METKKNKIKNIEKIQAPNTPSAVDDAADVMSNYSSKKKKYQPENKKVSIPPKVYEKPPHY